ncbi:MAG: homocysteine S-methyltransferase family protein [Clostridia bacterium]|nr:homocysteine S-methyltransferase family protein [Clostridia bacterium]
MKQTPMILDGGSGACLIQAGMPSGVCPEKWALEHPGVLTELQQNYAAAGSDVVYSFTFGGSAVKLASHGLSDECERMNEALVKLSKDAVGGAALVAGDIGPTGLLPKPFGDADFDTLYSVFAQQAKALENAGADLIAVETMMSLAEVKAAVLAAKASTDLPVYASMTCGSSGRTLSGCSPAAALVTLQANGADAFGLNCSLPPEGMLKLFPGFVKYAKIPLTAKPNGEYPDDAGVHHSVSPETFAANMKKLAELGVAALGGCCGSTPEHISALSAAVCDVEIAPPNCEGEYLAIERQIYELPSAETLSACKIYSPMEMFDAVDAGEKVIRVRIASPEDAAALSDMLIYANAPLSLVASDAESALRAAGICPARFLLDPESTLSNADFTALSRRLFAAV